MTGVLKSRNAILTAAETLGGDQGGELFDLFGWLINVADEAFVVDDGPTTTAITESVIVGLAVVDTVSGFVFVLVSHSWPDLS